MARLNIVEALNQALNQEMAIDPLLMILGEDVGREGGVFRVTDGLQKKFGVERVIDTPLAESGIVGTAIGLAISGMHPVVEIQFEGFVYPAFDQIVNHLARMRTRSRGRYSVKLVIRFPYSGGIHAPEHHSDSNEAIFVHTPGIKVVIPSSPYDAKGLLISAIRDPDPVIFMEPKRIYRAVKMEVPDEYYLVPIGKGKIVKEGKDCTVIGYGAMIKVILEAAEKLNEDGIDIEIVDLRTLSPLDKEIFISSVKKTKRCVIVHEAPRTCGIGSEISAILMEEAFLYLEAPVERVTGFDVVMPLAKGEHFYLPDTVRVVGAVKKTISF